MAKRKSIQRTSEMEGAVSDAFSEFQSLRDEMNDWKENMEGNNMEHLPKYEEVSEAHDTLENQADNEPDFPSGNMPEGLSTTVTWTDLHTYARSQSRQTRLSDATNGLDAVISAIRAFLDEHDDEAECWKADDVVSRDDLEQYANDLEEIKDEMDGVSFPGMY